MQPQSARAPRDARATLAVASLAAVAVAWSLLAGTGGLSDAGGAAAVQLAVGLAAAALATLAALGRLPLPTVAPAALAGAVALAGYTVLAALSARWSWSPAASRDDALTAACYLAAWVAGALLAGVPGARRRALRAVTALAALVCLVALLERVVTTPVQLNARLFGPIGHANGLAILAILAILGGVALAVEGSRRERVVGGAVMAQAALALLLTGSRSGAGLGVLALVAVILLTASGPRTALRALAPALVGAGVGVWAGTWSTFAATQSYAEVPAGGRELLIATVAVTALGGALAGLLPGESGTSESRRTGRLGDLRGRGRSALPTRPLEQLAAVAGTVVALVAVGALLMQMGGDGGGQGRAIEEAGSARLTSLSSNNRDHWWETAWDGFVDQPVSGTGAGTFRLLEQVTREPAIPAESAHNVVLEALAGTGLLGGLLMATAGAGLLVGAAAWLAPERGARDHAAAVALLAGAAAVFVQSLVEVDWDIEAVGVLATGSLGTLATRPAVPAEPTADRRLLGLAAVLLAGWSVTFAVAAVPPWLAERAAADAEVRILDDPRRALERAEAARRWDRRSVRPLMILGEAREAVGDRAGAKAAFEQAVRTEPRNYETWLRAGTQQHLNWGDARGALGTLERALALSGGNPTAAAALRDASASPTLQQPPG